MASCVAFAAAGIGKILFFFIIVAVFVVSLTSHSKFRRV
jgi:uncharacterized membrane protein YtjA (UPF0391 family)